MINYIKKLFSKKKEGLKKIASFGGHDFYTIEAIPVFTVNRFFHYIKKNEEISTLGIPLEYFLTIADQLDAISDKPEQCKLSIPRLTELIRFAVSREENKWYFLTIALIEAFILVDDEPLNEISEKHNEIKRKLFETNPDARFFFIGLAANYLKGLESSFDPSNFEQTMTAMLSDKLLLKNITTLKTNSKAG